MSDDKPQEWIILDEHPDIKNGKRKLDEYCEDILKRLSERFSIPQSAMYFASTPPESDEGLIKKYYGEGKLPNTETFESFFSRPENNPDTFGVDSSNIISTNNSPDTIGAIIRRNNYAMLQYYDESGELIFQEDKRTCHLCGERTMVIDHAKKEAENKLSFEREVWSCDGSVKQAFCNDCDDKEVYLKDGSWLPELGGMYMVYKHVYMYDSSHDYNCRLFWERIDDYEENGDDEQG